MIPDKCAGACLPPLSCTETNSTVRKDERGLHIPQLLGLLPRFSSSHFDTHNPLCWFSGIHGPQGKEAQV